MIFLILLTWVVFIPAAVITLASRRSALPTPLGWTREAAGEFGCDGAVRGRLRSSSGLAHAHRRLAHAHRLRNR